jgi:hypothetical protein
VHLEKEFEVPLACDAAYRCVATDETLLQLFPETRTELVASEGEQRTVRSHYTALGQEGVATFNFRFVPESEVRFEKVCDGKVWQKLEGTVRFKTRGEKTRVRIQMDGRTKGLIPEFTIKGAMKDQLDQMARALRQRLKEA